MILDSVFASLFIYISLSVILFSLGWFFLAMLARRRQEKVRAHCRKVLDDICNNENRGPHDQEKAKKFIRKRKWFFLESYMRLCDSIIVPEEQREKIRKTISACRIEAKLLADLKARNEYRSGRAAIYLSLFDPSRIMPALVSALEKKKNPSVKLLIASSMSSFGISVVIPSIIDSLQSSSDYYQQAVYGLLENFEGGIEEFYPLLIQHKQKEIKLLLIHLANRNCPLILRKYLETLVADPDKDIVHRAFSVLSRIQTEKLDHRKYLQHDDFLIRNLTAESLGQIPGTDSLLLLFEFMNDPVIRKSVCLAITAMVRSRPEFLKTVMYRYLNEQRRQASVVLADVLTNFVDYLMGKVIRDDAEIVSSVLVKLIDNNKIKEIINFANRNADSEIQTRLVELFARILKNRPDIRDECTLFMNDTLKTLLGLEIEQTARSRPKRRERHNIPLLTLFLFCAAILPSGGCALFAMRWKPVSVPDFFFLFTGYFNYLFAIYAGALSCIYILLLLFSIRGVGNQARKQALISNSMLFTSNVLPSISIISPAYNEEATIVESVNALFNLKYPDFEIIVVNDGSTDGTVEQLIKAFDLERTEVFVHNYLETQEIRAIYANKQYPELLVVDKLNGGKADSLNAGINISRKEYFSGIDADSLLEQDALLNLTSQFIFSKSKILAAGGNIFPANGCSVNKGTLTDIRIPHKHLGRIQTLEYIRSFMAGRIGWSELQLLLIISGAFGVFHRRTVINAGGYLTQHSRFKKDTVGEDMELVVRLSRTMRESKIPFTMAYAYNANCWTEVPERFKILASQRDRWQRGLLDILTFHWKMMFNPKYGRIGLVGFPYFLIFEVIGPWLEVQGFLIFAASLVLGWVSRTSAAVILMATIGLGMCVSLISMTISEYSRKYFPLRDKFILLVYAFVENFGIRQALNFLRVRGLVRMITKAEGWGKMERTGWNRNVIPQRSNT
ncbi:MAG: glycosyltransferase [Spirochaetales bacterium]|nr:glycosyltransferase [Spirochaetales bacterium]